MSNVNMRKEFQDIPSKLAAVGIFPLTQNGAGSSTSFVWLLQIVRDARRGIK